MTTKDMVIKILEEHPCLTSTEIKNFVYKTFGETISAQSAAGAMRTMVSTGLAGSSKNDKGKMVYWLNEKRW